MPREGLRERIKKDDNLSWYSHVVSDQGNGGASCGKCNHWLGSNPLDFPEKCPNCKRTLVEIGDIYMGGGGSDF